jgi:hypothetical protein
MATSRRPVPSRLVGFDPAAKTTNIDRSHSKRQVTYFHPPNPFLPKHELINSRIVPMKFLCLGLSRTGTSSLRQALLDLGISDVYHFTSVISENPPDADLWIKALEAKLEHRGPEFKKEDWDSLLGHCMAVSDHPCLTFTYELLEMYPDAQVILTVRDNVDVWYESVMDTIWKFVELRISPDVSWGRKFWRGLLDRGPFERMTELIHLNPVGMYWEFPTRGRMFYEEHNEKIRKKVPKDRLLEFNVKQGWGPLCEFLRFEEPEWDFPRVNDRAEFNRYQGDYGRQQNWVVVSNAMPYVTACVAGLFAGWYMYTRRR